jgi:hypothetical protein
MTLLNDRFGDIRYWLDSRLDGSIDSLRELEELLVRHWDSLDGGDADGMSAQKLTGRIESASWHSPILRFQIERHGGTVMGSTRAEVHAWTVNLDTGIAAITDKGHRQIRPMESRWDAKSAAKEVGSAILNGDESYPLVRWLRSGRIRPRLQHIVPSANIQTLEGRSRRFNRELEKVLEVKGWRRQKGGYWTLPPLSEG